MQSKRDTTSYIVLSYWDVVAMLKDKYATDLNIQSLPSSPTQTGAKGLSITATPSSITLIFNRTDAFRNNLPLE
jgi:hypothetical protein